MKLTPNAPGCLLAAGLLVAMVTTAGAATSLTPKIVLRPFTPTEQTLYNMKSAEISGGLSTTPIGEPVYLEVLVNIALPASNIVSVTWSLTGQPVGSAAVLTNSPLGANVPIYLPSDAQKFQVASRTMLRPDLRGQYTVSASIVTTSSGSTNLTQTLNAGVYMGVQTCELCHSGGVGAPNMVSLWTNTLHASKFTRGINGQIAGYGAGCISCHTVGYDVNTNAVNGGFDDVAKQLGWVFPSVLTNSNWASMQANYPSLANLANIQCENCHGPGSEHAYGLGDTNKIAVNWMAGNCGQCHDASTHHIKVPEWKNSRHAISTTTPSGPGREACVGCHTAMGFAGRLAGTTVTNTAYESISCAACHDPHDATNPHQLRNVGPVTLGDGTVVSGYGNGELCFNCHHSRNGGATNNVTNFVLGRNTWIGGSSFGPHDGPQGDMFMGANAITYGQNIPSSAHRGAITNACITCHMQETPAATDPSFLLAGGHTWNMSYNVVANGVTNSVDKTDVCVQCHGPISSFDMVREDYNGDGVIEGVQTEVQHLLDKLSTMLPNSTYVASGNYVADGIVKTSLSAKTNWPTKFLNAAYNWQFVNNDGSLGVHNVAYAVGILKASIADLTGDANQDGIPDAWQIQYFGSTSSLQAAPNYSAAGDGIPNWLKYSLGLNPTVAGIPTSDGVVWANGTSLNGGTNTVQIYTAAEVSFDTVAGVSYQLQGCSSLSGGWQPIGPAITGDGAAHSYVTPTRKNVQQYFRVVHTP